MPTKTPIKQKRLKILIADDHHIVRDGIKMVINHHFNGSEIIEAENGHQVIEAIIAHPEIGLIMIDYYMPQLHGIDLLDKLADKTPDTPVIFFSSADKPALIREAIDHGAAGFIPKTTSPKIIVNAINLVLSGGIYLPASVLQPTAETAGDDYTDDGYRIQAHKLTSRQKEILALTADGLSNKEIARQLGISPYTVKIHLTAISRIFGVNNRMNAVELARKEGLID